MTTYAIVAGGVTTQYDQKIVRLINRSKASPEAACVIYKGIDINVHQYGEDSKYLGEGQRGRRGYQQDISNDEHRTN